MDENREPAAPTNTMKQVHAVQPSTTNNEESDIHELEQQMR
jgi:hypothetical protein